MFKALYIIGDEVEYVSTCDFWHIRLIQRNNLQQEFSNFILKLQFLHYSIARFWLLPYVLSTKTAVRSQGTFIMKHEGLDSPSTI